jgi:hypothetical protein
MPVNPPRLRRAGIVGAVLALAVLWTVAAEAQITDDSLARMKIGQANNALRSGFYRLAADLGLQVAQGDRVSGEVRARGWLVRAMGLLQLEEFGNAKAALETAISTPGSPPDVQSFARETLESLQASGK